MAWTDLRWFSVESNGSYEQWVPYEMVVTMICSRTILFHRVKKNRQFILVYIHAVNVRLNVPVFRRHPIRVSTVCLSLSRPMPGYYLQVGHDPFAPNIYLPTIYVKFSSHSPKHNGNFVTETASLNFKNQSLNKRLVSGINKG
jgi:hypothetical protein